MHGICKKILKYAINMQLICKIFARLYAEYVVNMQKICRKYAENMLIYGWNMQKITGICN